MGKHVNWVDVANSIGRRFGWTNCDDNASFCSLFNDPPRAPDTTINDMQQTLLLVGLLNAVRELIVTTQEVRRAVDGLPERMEKKRLTEELKLAKEQRKAAEARERAAQEELRAKFAEPPVMYQCDRHTLENLAGRIRHRF